MLLMPAHAVDPWVPDGRPLRVGQRL